MELFVITQIEPASSSDLSPQKVRRPLPSSSKMSPPDRGCT
jgi:hypothetical protein